MTAKLLILKSAYHFKWGFQGKKDYRNSFLAHAQMSISGNPSSSTIPIYLFLTHYRRTAWKASYSIQENTKRLIVKMFAPVINKIVGVSLDHCVSSVSSRFVSSYFWTLWITFHVKNSIRSTSASTALTQVSHWSHNAYTANRHLRCSRERNKEQR